MLSATRTPECAVIFHIFMRYVQHVGRAQNIPLGQKSMGLSETMLAFTLILVFKYFLHRRLPAQSPLRVIPRDRQMLPELRCASPGRDIYV